MVAGSFCFQAEDGIRYLVRSRGLGDVYKRQDEDTHLLPFDGTIDWEDVTTLLASSESYSGTPLTLSLIHI